MKTQTNPLTEELKAHAGQALEGERILRIAEVCRMLGVHASTVRRMYQARRFPKPFVIGERARGWRASDVNKWIEEK